MGIITARVLGRDLPYLPVLQKMREFTDLRTEDTRDEIWFLEHQPVFTLGRNGQKEQLIRPGNIPVESIDRGGQVTYHGPGQLVMYLLLDIRRQAIGVRQLVVAMEQAVIELLAQSGIKAEGKRDAPGVYVAEQKIAALGLRVSRGKTYHGLSLNIAMDLEPFSRINPCGYEGLTVTQCQDLGVAEGPFELAGELALCLAKQLGYEQIEWAVDELGGLG